MNQVIHTIMDHRSIRSYTDEVVSEEIIETIARSAQMAATSSNGQQVTVLAIRDKEKLGKLGELCGNQSYVTTAPVFFIFCSDFYRVNLTLEARGEKLENIEGLDALIVGATDVGISLGNAIVAAESLGLGTVPIGGIRREMDKVIELLELPKYVFPVSGLVVGYPANRSQVKPRLPLPAFLHHESYQKNLIPLIQEYDATYQAYVTVRSEGKDTKTWSETISRSYSRPYNPTISQAVRNQGYKLQ